MQTVADLPLLPNLSITAVRATLGRQDIALLVDTGAAISVVSRNASERFELHPGADAHYTVLSGIGGVTFAPMVMVHSLGRGLARGLELPVAADFPAPVDGLPCSACSAPISCRTTTSISTCRMAISASTARKAAPTTCSRSTRPTSRSRSGTTTAGASATLIDAADAARVGVTTDLLASDQLRSVRGIDSRTLQARRHRFGSLEIGDERMSNVSFTVAGGAIGGTLLGRDVLRFNRVWISYRRHLLFIQPVQPDRMVHRERRGGCRRLLGA